MDELVIPIWLLAKTLPSKIFITCQLSFNNKLENMAWENWNALCLFGDGEDWEKEKTIFFIYLSVKANQAVALQIPSKAMMF